MPDRDTALFKRLLQPTGENELVDYKLSLAMDTEQQKAELVKDVASFCNQQGGYLVYGVDDQLKLQGLCNKSLELFDITRLGDLLGKYLSPTPTIKADRYSFQGKEFGIISIQEFSEIPVLVRTAIGKLKPGDIFVRTQRGQSKRIASESEMRGILERCFSKRKEEIRRLITAALPPIEKNPKALSKIFFKEIKERLLEEWGKNKKENWDSLRHGCLWVFDPKNSLEISLEPLEEKIKNATLEWSGYSIPWSRTDQPERMQGFLENIWPQRSRDAKTESLYFSDMAGIYARVNTHGQVAWFRSYQGDIPTKDSQRNFPFLLTLHHSLLFIKFVSQWIQVFNKKNKIAQGSIYFMATDTRERALYVEDRFRFLPLLNSYVAKSESILESISISEDFNLIEKSVELAKKIFYRFGYSGEDKVARISKALIDFSKNALIELKIPYE